MHKANTYYDEEQEYTNEIYTEPLPTETEQRTLHFFDTCNHTNLFFKINLIFSIAANSTGFMLYFKTVVAWICGLEKADELDRQSIHSGPRLSIISIPKENVSSWHKQCSYAAIILLSLCIFVWAFFTDYRIRLI